MVNDCVFNVLVIEINNQNIGTSMVKVVRIILVLVATLWYTTSNLNSNATVQIWKPPIVENAAVLDYFNPFDFDKEKYSPEDIDCLAKNIYFEAGMESTAGKLAVANVTINRTVQEKYPNTICEVVQEGIHYYNTRKKNHYPVRNRCQFSWYCDGKIDEPRQGKSWAAAQVLAVRVLIQSYEQSLIDITDGATHYHANWMEKYPKWSEEKIVVTSIDNHIFYRSRL